MKMLHPALVLAGLLYLSGCRNQEPELPAGDLPEFRIEVFSRELAECKERKGYCARLIAEFPVFESNLDTAVRRQLNAAIVNAIASQVTGNSTSQANTFSLEEAARHLFDLYYADNQKTSFYATWEWTTSSEILYLSSRVLSMSIENYNYTGGAHPNSQSVFLNINLQTGKKIQLKDLVWNMKELEKLARSAYFQAKGFSGDEGVMNATASDEQFQFPENFGITEEGLYFFYNAYEAGSYAEGPLDFVLPWSELKGIARNFPL